MTDQCKERECARAGERQTANDELYEPPRNAVEQSVADIWAELLGIERAGVQDNFLLLGGESLLAAQAASRIRALYNCEVGVRSIFVGTVADVAAEIISKAQVPVTEGQAR